MLMVANSRVGSISRCFVVVERLEKVTLPLKAARHDVIAKLKSFRGFLRAAKKPNAVSLRFAVRRHINAFCK